MIRSNTAASSRARDPHTTVTYSDGVAVRGIGRRAVVIGIAATTVFGAALVATASPKITTKAKVSTAPDVLEVSTHADRANPVPLAGATVTGPAYVFLATSKSVTQATFGLDGSKVHVENRAPWDLIGGTASAAAPLGAPLAATTRHLQVIVTIKGAAEETLNASFVQLPIPAPSSAPTSAAPTTKAPTTTAPSAAPTTTAAPSSVAPTTTAPITTAPTTTAPTSAAATKSSGNSNVAVSGGTNAGGALPPGSYTNLEFTGHVSLVTSGSYAFVNDVFDQGFQAGAFGADPAVRASLTNVEISNTSGTPGAPNARGISVLPGAVVTGSAVTVHHTLSDGIGVLGGELTLQNCLDYDNYGGAPLNTDHVDGLQVTSGTANLTDCALGETPAGVPTRTGNVQCKGDAGTATCNLTDVTVAGYGSRIAVNFQPGTGGGAGGVVHGLTIVTSGSTGSHLVVRAGASVAQGVVSIS